MKPINGRRKPRPIPEVLTADEQTRLLGQLEPTDCPSKLRNLTIIRLLLDTGLRARELRELRLRNLDLKSGRLKVRGKGQKERMVWLSEDDLVLLKDWLDYLAASSNDGPSSELIFTSLDGKKPICGRWLRGLVKRLAQQAGIDKDVHLHTLRHTFATDHYRRKKNIRLTQKALGHSSLSSTEIYTHICDDELEESFKNLRNGG